MNRKEQSDLSKQQPHKIVDCSSCGTRYSIPLDKISNGTIPVRCGKCGNVFEVSADDEPVDSRYGGEFIQDADVDDDVSMDNISIPEENEIEVDGLFDEIEEGDEDEFESPDELAAFDNFEDPDLEEDDFGDEAKGPTAAYLESVQLSGQADDAFDEESELDDISQNEKDDLFLKPSSVEESSAVAKQIDADDSIWPDIHDETGASDVGLEEFVELDELDDMPDSADDFDADDPLELQEISERRRGNKPLIIILMIVLAVILGAAAWFLTHPIQPRPQTPPPIEKFSKQTRLKLMEPLKGRFTTNEASGEKIFMLEGQIRNDFPPQTVINWIEVKGVLFDKNDNLISEAKAYAGKIITAKALKEAGLAELKAIRGDHTNEMDLELDSQQTVPFQILFFNAGDNIQKLQAQIDRFSRRQVQ